MIDEEGESYEVGYEGDDGYGEDYGEEYGGDYGEGEYK